MAHLLVLSRDAALHTALTEQLAALGTVEVVAEPARIAASFGSQTVHLVIIDLAWVEAIPALDQALSTVSERPPILALGPVPPGQAWSDAVVLARPLRLAELLSTAGRLVKRMENQQGNILVLSPSCRFYPQEKRLVHPDLQHETALTETEARILSYLFRHQGETVSRESLLETIWGYGDQVTTHTLETHIYRLRNKLDELGRTGVEIATAPGGYRLAL